MKGQASICCKELQREECKHGGKKGQYYLPSSIMSIRDMDVDVAQQSCIHRVEMGCIRGAYGVKVGCRQ